MIDPAGENPSDGLDVLSDDSSSIANRYNEMRGLRILAEARSIELRSAQDNIWNLRAQLTNLSSQVVRLESERDQLLVEVAGLRSAMADMDEANHRVVAEQRLRLAHLEVQVAHLRRIVAEPTPREALRAARRSVGLRRRSQVGLVDE